MKNAVRLILVTFAPILIFQSFGSSLSAQNEVEHKLKVRLLSNRLDFESSEGVKASFDLPDSEIVAFAVDRLHVVSSSYIFAYCLLEKSGQNSLIVVGWNSKTSAPVTTRIETRSLTGSIIGICPLTLPKRGGDTIQALVTVQERDSVVTYLFENNCAGMLSQLGDRIETLEVKVSRNITFRSLEKSESQASK